tara:strand:+ start:233 stop:427 length:195 start_codon:yes stop_codon:yes gene_type:complete
MVMPIKKKVIEIYDKNKGQWVKAVIDGNVDPDKSNYMYDLIMAQIEIYTVQDEMELGVATIEKN